MGNTCLTHFCDICIMLGRNRLCYGKILGLAPSFPLWIASCGYLQLCHVVSSKFDINVVVVVVVFFFFFSISGCGGSHNPFYWVQAFWFFGVHSVFTKSFGLCPLLLLALDMHPKFCFQVVEGNPSYVLFWLHLLEIACVYYLAFCWCLWYECIRLLPPLGGCF